MIPDTYGYASSVDGLPPELHPTYEDDFDRIGWTRFFHELPCEETEVMVSLFLGMKPKEIMHIHHFTSMRRFYALSSRLRQSYREKKAQFLGYD